MRNSQPGSRAFVCSAAFFFRVDPDESAGGGARGMDWTAVDIWVCSKVPLPQGRDRWESSFARRPHCVLFVVVRVVFLQGCQPNKYVEEHAVVLQVDQLRLV